MADVTHRHRTAAAAATASRLRRGGRPARSSGSSSTLVMLGVALAILVPIVYAVLGGFKTNGQLRRSPGPDPARSVGLRRTTTDVLVGEFAPTFWRELLNSVVIAAIAVTVTVVFASLAAFVFARIAFRGREALYTLFVFGLLFPTAVAILPLYILVRQLGLPATRSAWRCPRRRSRCRSRS